jgi:Hemerythrin HHE cation binding domain
MATIDFIDTFRDEHRQLRDLLLGLRSAIEAGDSAGIRQGVSELAAAAGPHFYYEGEALYPALAELYGDEYVERLQREHERELELACDLAELAAADELSPGDAERAVELIGNLLPHVSERDGIAVIMEVLPEERVREIANVREHAHKRRVSIHEIAKRKTKSRGPKRARARVSLKSKARKTRASKTKARARAKAAPTKKRAK